MMKMMTTTTTMMISMIEDHLEHDQNEALAKQKPNLNPRNK